MSGAEPGLGLEGLLAAESVLGFGVEEGELLAAEAVLGFEVEEEELFETGAVSGLELAEAAFWEAGAGEAEPFISVEIQAHVQCQIVIHGEGGCRSGGETGKHTQHEAGTGQ